MKFTEAQLKQMASPISETEDEKCKNAIRMVRDAMKLLDYSDDGNEIVSYRSDTYAYTLDLYNHTLNRTITLLVQGSYANKTNIPSESDVDVAVILESTFSPKYRYGVTNEHYRFIHSSYSAYELKNDVEKALNIHFKNKGIERHDKCVKVAGNTYRVDADVVPSQRYRDYSNDYFLDENNFIKGIVILPDSGGKIINYPELHIENGLNKNKQTSCNFKKCVRIIKNMKEIMTDAGYRVSLDISSFGLESLLWNVPDSVYLRYQTTLRFVFDEVISYLGNHAGEFSNYKEVNGIKSLFVDDQISALYQGFINDLYQFYEYDIKEK